MNKYFDRHEFKCKDECGFDSVDAELLEVLTDVREHFKLPLIITSGNRCKQYNESIGGKSHSYHTRGMAADIVIKGVSSIDVFDYLIAKYPDQYGIADGHSFVHIDVRSKKGRWTY
jgi:uncharacterized protein YcbK (DUF882 family)